ncbi:MAG: hypothetical protein ACLFMX_06840 [Halobacteriales archaeon]
MDRGGPGTLEPCKRCGEPIDPSVDECPECGNRPKRKAQIAAVILTGIGVVLVLINPLIGLPLLAVGVFGFFAVHRAHYSPTDHDF